MLIIFILQDNYSIKCNQEKNGKVQVKAKFTDLEWAKENLKVLSQNHVYHTDYAITNWQFLKKKTLK
jgi:hypothetical protein